MENPLKLISKGYEKFDDGVMYLVNKGVRAWNWTTGRTRADLAAQFVTLGAIGSSIGGIGLLEYGLGAVYAGFCLLGSYLMIKKFLECDRMEAESLEKVVLNIEIEEGKQLAKYSAPLIPIIPSAIHLSNDLGLETKATQLEDYFGVGGWTSYAASMYIMRADCLPPRKNVVARASEKIRNFVDELGKVPAPTPAPVPVRTGMEKMETLESYVVK